MTSYTVIRYEPRFLQDFVDLNQQWIEQYFKLEAMDLAQLKNPAEFILNPGGEIFFVLDGEKVLGTCAMVPHGPACYEVAKMAVGRAARGRGIGDILMKTCLDWAREKRAQKVMLLSNTILEPAISLYKKHGFQVVHLGSHPDYDRCNIEMQIELSAPAHANA